MAMLTLVETLAPTERAVFVLRQFFDMCYGEIAEAIGKPPAAVRQITLRARACGRRPRCKASPSEQQAVVDRFVPALRTGQQLDVMDQGSLARLDEPVELVR